MRENNRFCFCNVRYKFPFSYAIYLFSGAKLEKKEIKRDLTLSVFLANLTIVFYKPRGSQDINWVAK